jgi:site-specific DNA-methyltransferase (adenine-specific)
MTGQATLTGIEAPEHDYRLGRWQDVLADVECDAAIFDAPYGERTHRGHDAGAKQRNQLLCSNAVGLGYDFLVPADVHEIVAHWSPRTHGWICSLTCFALSHVWHDALEAAGRYVFTPLPVIECYRPRLLGDGPGCSTVWLVVARPRSREFLSRGWGSLPGEYRRHPGESKPRRMGGKTLGVMRDIVRDYSKPGDLVCDMFGGDATTGRAALELGRRFIGCERDPEAWASGLARLREPVAQELFAAHAPVQVQETLW